MVNVSTVEDESTRYNRRNILRSERMYGAGFQSPGRLPIMEKFCRRLPMKSGMTIIDIGSGLGGAAFYFAERYDASVVGIDVAPAMVEISTERKVEKGLSKVRFIGGDVCEAQLPGAGFDLVWSRDCILYIQNKTRVWQAITDCLKPGGSLFITDFCRRPDQLSPEFAEYLDRCEYHVQDIKTYAAALTAAGLLVSAQEDITDQFIVHLEDEQRRLKDSRTEFLREFDDADYRYLMERWDKKLAFCRSGDFRWGLFIARKPGG